MNYYIKSIAVIGLVMGSVGITPIAPTVAQPVAPAVPIGAADRLLQQGLRQYESEQFAAALASWQQSLVLDRAIKDRRREGETLRNIGRAYYMLKDMTQATAHFERSLAIAREVKNRQNEGLNLRNLGVICEDQNQPGKAIEYYQQSIKIAQEVGDRTALARTLQNLGQIEQTQNNFSSASTNLKQSLAIWRELKDQTGEADTLLALGDLYRGTGGWLDDAIEYYKQSLPIFRALNDRTSEGVALGGLGRCYESKRQHQAAIDALESSLTIARAAKNRRNEMIVLADLAKSYQSLDELANQRWKSGLLSQDFRQLPQSIEDATKSVQYSQQSLTIARAIQNRRSEATALGNLGRSYAVLRDYPKAIAAHQQRLAIVREFQDWPTEAKTLMALGNIYTAQADYATAITQHQAAIAIYREQQQRSEAQFAKSQFPKSNQSIKSRPLSYELREAVMYLGDSYERSGNYTQAIQSYQEALGSIAAIRESAGDRDIILLRRLGYALAKRGDLPEATSTLRLAIDKEDIFRTGLGYGTSSSGWKATDADRIRMAEAQAEDYRQLLQVLVRQNRTDMALEVAEESRARTFVELLSERISGRPLGKDWPTPPNIDAIRQIAKAQNATLVEYAIASSESLYIWVIKPTGEISFRSTPLEPKQGIPQLVARGRSEIKVRGGRSDIPKIARANITDVTPPATSSNLAKLHQVLIDPIAADLPTDPNQRVIFLPQGELFLLPFAALRDAQGKYLIERHTIAIAPSIQTLNLTRTQAAQSFAQGRSVVVGDPTMPSFEGEVLPPLPGARQEAIAIGEILKTTPLLGAQATKATVLEQLRTASTVHFATHGLLDTIKGDMPGAIALAPSGTDNGLLSASEIFDLKLRANLVVLSACDTGRGAINGDGVIGLSRSLIASGVPSVVVSLWAVDDNSTRVFMSDFYRNRQTNSNKAQALRQAMLNTMKQYPNPRDWAAFTIVGESD
jgi:CHAT domain-containing protein